MSDYEFRFGGIARLYGRAGLERLRRARVCVVGIGGVGSWVVEALARSGIGHITLVDLDEICVSNVNRQLPALEGTIGRAKVEVMAERVRAIHPEAEIKTLPIFFTETTAAEILAPGFDYVVDAIDSVANKCRLIVSCRERNIPVLVCGGAGGRRDATQVRLADLTQVSHDRLIAQLRKRLRKEHNFPASGEKFGIPAVYSNEAPVFPQADGSVCGERDPQADSVEGETVRLNCNWGLGSATFVTGAFGFVAAGEVVRQLAETNIRAAS